jgi:pantothenate synthetase
MKSAYASGNSSVLELREIAAQLVAREPLAHLEYIDIIDASNPHTSCHGDIVRPASRAVIAVWFGDIRLIDNVALSI